MIDVGLLLSVLTSLGAAIVLAWYREPLTESSGLIDAVAWPLLVGVVVGRMTSLMLDDPSSLTNVRDILAIRGGVEFWPGLAGGLVVVSVKVRRSGLPVTARLADLAPYGLAAAAGYQATCLVREGCYGPGSPIGLRTDAFHPTVFPVELAGALVLLVAAISLVRRRERQAPWFTIVAAVATLAVERSVTSFWLPVVGDGLSRAHVASIVVALSGALVLVVAATRTRSRVLAAPQSGSA